MMNVLKKIMYFVFAKSALSVVKKITYMLTVFFACGILFHFWLYPKIEESARLKGAFDYFKFLNDIEKKSGSDRIKFLKSTNADQFNGIYKYMVYKKQDAEKLLDISTKEAMLKKIYKDNNSRLIKNISSIDLYQSGDKKAANSIKKTDPLFEYKLEIELLDDLKNIRSKEDAKSLLNKIQKLTDENNSIDFVKKIEQVVKKKI